MPSSVALFILKAAAELTIKSVRDLMDVNLPEEEVAEIQSIIKDHSGKFAGFHELRTRRSGSDRFIDLHMVVSRDMSVEQSHRLVDHIEKDIPATRPSVITHVEPCDNDAICKGCQAKECSKYVAPVGKALTQIRYCSSLFLTWLAWTIRPWPAVALQTLAHFTQWSMFLCISHSSAHASQISAHMAHEASESTLSLDMYRAVVTHTSAQSRSSLIQSTSFLTSFSLRHALAHASHDSAQS